MDYQELDFACTIRQTNPMSGDLRTGEATIIYYPETGDIDINTDAEFSEFWDTKGDFQAWIELPAQYLHIEDFELNLEPVDSELSDFYIVENAEYERFKKFLLFEKLDAKGENKSDSISNKSKI